uniref:Cyclic nucleotide-binding domain-containing protein n=1 Tax=Taenia asiatica TaxID=60517 RepID=A0A0R3W0L7_TAEAS
LWKYNDEEIRRFSDATGQLNKSLNLSVPAIFTQPQTQPTLESYKSGQILLRSMPNREKGGVSIQEMAFMRDLKRRRQSYRGIHTAKKSYIEVLREVIEQHTALLNHSADPDQNSSRPYCEDARAENSERTADKQGRRSDQFSNSGSDSMRSSERRHRLRDAVWEMLNNNEARLVRSERNCVGVSRTCGIRPREIFSVAGRVMR